MVDVFGTDGTLTGRLISQGTLNAPWGLAIAPAGFGAFGGSLIIALVDYFYSHANYAVMASNVIIAFALNLPGVQRVFDIRRDDEAHF